MEGFLSILGARVVRMAVTLVSLPVIVRALGPSMYGDYGFLISTFSLLMILVSAGVTEGAQKFVAENRGEGWEAAVVRYYGGLALVLAVAGAAILAGVTASGVVTALFEDRFVLYFYLLAVFVLAAQFRSFSRRTLMALGLERYSEPLQVLSKVTWVVVGLGLVWSGYGVAGMLAGNIVASALVAAVGLTLVFRHVSLRQTLSPLPEEFPRRELLSFNVLNILLVLLTMSLYHVDVVMVRTLIGSETTGYYKAALAVAEYLWFVPLSLQALLLHSASALWSEGSRERVERLSARITRYTLLFTGLLAVGLATLADRVIPLYFGAEFAPVVLPLLLLLPGTVGFAAARPLMSISRGHGNLWPLIVATGGAALINVVLNALLIPRYGMAGAATATSVGYASMFVFHVASARRLGYDPLRDLRPVRVTAATVLTGVVTLAVARAIQGDLVALAVVPPVGLLANVSAALVTGAVRRDELGSLLASLPLPVPGTARL